MQESIHAFRSILRRKLFIGLLCLMGLVYLTAFPEAIWADVPLDGVINFDKTPEGKEIANDTAVDTLYSSYGVRFSSKGSSADGSVYARDYLPSPLLPDTRPNIQTLFKSPLATDFNEKLGIIIASFSPPVAEVDVAVIPLDEKGMPYLCAYDAFGNQILCDTRESTPPTYSPNLKVSDQTNRIAWVEYSAFENGSMVIFDTLTFHRIAESVTYADPIWVDDDNVSGTEDGTSTYPFNTIAEAMNVAVTHTIRVRAGTYYEDVVMKDGVKLWGAGAVNTTIHGVTTTITCSGVGSQSLIAGFTLTGAKLGILCTVSSPTIHDNIITHITGGTTADGIRVDYSSPLIQNNVIAHVEGMGIRGQGDSAPRIINNTIYDYGYYAGISFAALNIGSVSPEIRNNIIMRGNEAPVGGVLWKIPCTPIIAYNDVVDPENTTGTGSFYAVFDGTYWNEASGGSGAISEDPSFMDVSNDNFYLKPDSPCIDAGDPAALYNDSDGSRNDMGAFGGNPFNPGGSGHAGSGFIFTSIGKVPVTEIDQNTASLSYGLINVSTTTAADYHIPQYVDSPLGGELWIRGLFGYNDDVDYYQIYITPEGGTESVPLDSGLSKLYFTINLDGTVNTTTVQMGPQTIGGVSHLYQLNTEGYWSEEDLRIVWNTTGLNGRYRLDYAAYQLTGPDTVVPVALPPNELDHLVIYLDNTPMQLSINNVMYSDHTNIIECEEIRFPHNGDSSLIFNITAFHPTGFMNYYSLNCAWGHDHYGGSFTYDQYVGSHDSPPPSWTGVQNFELSARQPVDGVGNVIPWEDCAYAFHLSGGTRATNGSWYLQGWTVTDLHAVETIALKTEEALPCADCPPKAELATEGQLEPLQPLPPLQKPATTAKSIAKLVPGDTVWVDDDSVGYQDGTEQYPFSSISVAINTAATGGAQSVRVLPGVYSENVVMVDGINLIGSGAQTTLLTPSSGTGVSCFGIGVATVLMGFTITNCDLGIYCYSSTLSIRENYISNMNITSLAADGIRMDDSSPMIRNNVISGVGGMGIRAQGNCIPTIENNTIYNYHYYTAISFAALNIGAGSPVIKNNIIVRGNTAPVGGIFWRLPCTPLVSYNDVVDPANVTGGGSYYAEHDTVTWSEVPGGLGAISIDPRFVDAVTGCFQLAHGSPCIDAGDPAALYNDLDGSRNDMGAYGGQRLEPGGSSHTGSGFIFTGIGNVPINQIVEEPSDPSHGLLRVDGVSANQFHIPAYWDSPLGGYLWLHGLFGASDNVDYYQILAAPYGTSATETLTDPLAKTQFTINLDGTVTRTRVVMGPQTVGGVPNVYLLNKSGYWTYTDLRYIWNTTGLNGKYTVSYRGYHQLGDGSLVEVPLPRNDLDHFTIVLNNTAVEARIDDIAYADGTSIPECGKIELPHNGSFALKFTFTGWHPEGFLRYYILNSTYGNNHFGGQFAYDQYQGYHESPPPTWQGVYTHSVVAEPLDTSGNPLPWHTCAYQFYMEASTRVTDGYSYLYWDSDRFIQSVITTTGTVDSDGDGVPDVTEAQGANNGDSNNDGIPDKEQPYVASLPNASDGRYLTLMTAEGHVLREVEAINTSSLETLPDGEDFPFGLLSFEIAGVSTGEDVTLTIALPSGVSVDSYYKYGKTSANPNDHWYDFMFDGVTGAQISTGMVLLHFRDGLRGDDDLLENGAIKEPGGPSRGWVYIKHWEDY